MKKYNNKNKTQTYKMNIMKQKTCTSNYPK